MKNEHGNEKTIGARPTDRRRPRVVIVGAGFGGLEAAKTLRKQPFDITIVDRRNHHLFQPLLYQVATAALSPSNIAVPIRPLFRDFPNVKVRLAEVKEVVARKRLLKVDNDEIPYDYLLLAAGSTTSYFGHNEWAWDAPGLKNLEDAIEIRKRVLSAFELAEASDDPEQQRALLTFVVIGGGPTGVEMAGAIAEMARFTLDQEFRDIDPPTQARVILAEGADRLLGTFHPDLSAYAQEALEKLGVEVRTGTLATELDRERVRLGDETISTRTIVWAAGIAASPLGRTLGLEVDRMGRVPVREDLSVAEHPEILVIGDMARFENPDGSVLPGVSPVAIQQGKHAARNIIRKISGKETLPFRYLDKGMMATIGRNSAVADVRLFRFRGFFAWVAWIFLHIMYLVGFRNRVVTFFEWAYAYLTFSRGSRLITWSLAAEEKRRIRASQEPE